MNKIKTNKVTYLAAAVLATASLLTVNTNNAKADTVKSDSQTDNSQVPTNQVTENDVSSAQKKVNDLQQIANDKQNTYQQMQNDNQNAMTRAQNDVNTAQNNKVVAQKTYDQAVTANVQNNQAIDTNQKATEETIVAQQHNSQDIKDNQAKIQTAQTKLNQDKQHSGKDATSIPTKSEIDQARKAVERGERETANDLIASSDYVKAVKKYGGLDQYGMQIWFTNQSNYDKDMYQGSRATIENKANDYKHNKEDEQHQVDLDHITPDEYQEINEYAIRLINSVRSQTGRPNLILNKDVMKMAQVIADKYNEDGRSIFDGKGHDYKAVNDAARQFSLVDDPTNNSQYYENMSGWPTNVTSFINHDKTNLDAHNWYGWYVNSDPTITHTVSMDYIKQNIYLDLAGMFFNDHEWAHAAGLLSLLGIGDMNQDNDTMHYAFGMSISVLPNTNDVSTHYLIVPDYAYVHSNNPKVTPISNQADEQVTSLAQEKANLREAQAKYQALLDASKGVSTQNQTLIADQDTLDQLQDQANKLNIEKSALQDKLNDLAKEKIALLQRKQELANAIKDSEAKLIQAEADLQAKQEVVKHLSKSLPHTQAELDKAENDAKQAQARADQAKEIYQKVLSVYQAEQQAEHQTTPAKPDTDNTAKPDNGNAAKTDKGNAAKPDTGSTAKPNNGNIAKPATNTIETVKHNVLMRKNRAFYLRNGKTVLKFKSYKQVVNYLLKHKISTEVRSNEVIKLTKNARFYTKSGKRTLHLIKRGKKLHISEFVMIKGHLYAHLAHNKFYIRATRLF